MRSEHGGARPTWVPAPWHRLRSANWQHLKTTSIWMPVHTAMVLPRSTSVLEFKMTRPTKIRAMQAKDLTTTMTSTTDRQHGNINRLPFSTPVYLILPTPLKIPSQFQTMLTGRPKTCHISPVTYVYLPSTLFFACYLLSNISSLFPNGIILYFTIYCYKLPLYFNLFALVHDPVALGEIHLGFGHPITHLTCFDSSIDTV